MKRKECVKEYEISEELRKLTNNINTLNFFFRNPLKDRLKNVIKDVDKPRPYPKFTGLPTHTELGTQLQWLRLNLDLFIYDIKQLIEDIKF
jgi:hypothetical protein